jgi:RNA polymerase sigma-70 factor (ECF subfamily)
MQDSAPDPDAEIVALLTSHQTALRLYVASLLPGECQATDVAQQANTTIWKKRADFVIGSNFKAWIFSIARYEMLNFRKQQARDSKLIFNDELTELMADELPDHVGDLECRRNALRSCLAKLKTADQSLIKHRYFHRTPLKDYAEQIGRSAGGLKVTLYRLRSVLQRCIQTQLAEEA